MNKLNVIAEPGTQQVILTRTFDAPRELVYRAYTDPTLIPKWWGRSTRVDKMEVRPGGIWRFVQYGDDGSQNGFHGVFHNLTAPERIVYTFEWEGMPGHVLLETIDFADEGGKTLLTDSMVFQAVEDRDGMLAYGMETGANEGMDRLEKLLESL